MREFAPSLNLDERKADSIRAGAPTLAVKYCTFGIDTFHNPKHTP